MEDLRRSIGAGRLRFPVMPSIATQVQEAVSRPDSSARVLSEIIETDPGMAARIVRLANSAMFAGLSEARELSFAIARLGSAMVVSIVLGAAAKDLFEADESRFETLLEEAWERSLLCAAAARHVSRLPGVPGEEAFLAGLLHSTGDPVLADACVTVGVSCPVRDLTVDELRHVLDELRATAGAELLRRWRVPRGLVEAVSNQSSEITPLRAAAPLDVVVSAAARFAHRELRNPGSGKEALVDHPGFRAMGGDRADAVRVTELSLQELHELCRLF
jgi:HD-like signal output (HDOD) protein